MVHQQGAAAASSSLGKKLRQLGKERIGEDLGHFLVALAMAVAHQLADIHIERRRQPLQ